MKKSIFFMLAFLCVATLFSQTIDFTKDGRHFYIASPNGRYYAGTINEGPGCFFDAESKQHFMTDSSNVSIYAITNDGDAVGSYLGFASIWHKGGEWEKLPGLEVKGGSHDEFAKGEIISVSSDGQKYMSLIEIAEESFLPALYFKNEMGGWSVNTLPAPKQDEVYKMKPQYIQVIGMNYDATRIFGRYLTEDGFRELLFVWEKDKNAADNKDSWSYRFLVSKALVKPDVNIDEIMSKSDFDNVSEYQEYRRGFESGVIFDLSPYSSFSYSGSGRYFPINKIDVEWNEEYMTEMKTFTAAVIDVDNDQLIIFDSISDLSNTGTNSVNDNGEVMIYTPALATFRRSFVVSIDNPTVAVSLNDYTKERSNGKINLEDYMVYQRELNGPLILAEGSARWATEGNAYVTFNYDEMNETNVPHCYMVRFDGKVDNPVVMSDIAGLDFYPNPTDGLLNFSSDVENVKVYDLTGRLIFSEAAVCNQVSLSSLNQGSYFVEAVKDGQRVISKVIIAK